MVYSFYWYYKNWNAKAIHSPLTSIEKKSWLCLGDAQHVATLRQLHADTRQGLADCLYSYAAQSGLPTSSTVKLLDHLSALAPGIEKIKNETLSS